MTGWDDNDEDAAHYFSPKNLIKFSSEKQQTVSKKRNKKLKKTGSPAIFQPNKHYTDKYNTDENSKKHFQQNKEIEKQKENAAFVANRVKELKKFNTVRHKGGLFTGVKVGNDGKLKVYSKSPMPTKRVKLKSLRRTIIKNSLSIDAKITCKKGINSALKSEKAREALVLKKSLKPLKLAPPKIGCLDNFAVCYMYINIRCIYFNKSMDERCICLETKSTACIMRFEYAYISR